MKKIGLVGGIGPASTIAYYQGLVAKCHSDMGAKCYPEIVIDSVDMSKHDAALAEHDYSKLSGYLLSSLSHLKAAGAEIAAITANTEHIVWDCICDRFPLPVISIVDATVQEIRRRGFRKVLILGTSHTLRNGLYAHALSQNDISPIVPNQDDITTVGNLIYPNLENGIVVPADRTQLIQLAEQYIVSEQVDALLLACTELSLAIKPGDICVPVLDTTQIHINEIYRIAQTN